MNYDPRGKEITAWSQVSNSKSDVAEVLIWLVFSLQEKFEKHEQQIV